MLKEQSFTGLWFALGEEIMKGFSLPISNLPKKL